MRCRRALIRSAVLLAGALVVALPVPPAAQAGCGGPTLGIGPAVDNAAPPTDGAVLSAGQPVTVSGVWFHSGCDDTPSRAGCGAAQPSSEAPLTAVRLSLRQGSSEWILDTRDAGSAADQYSITWHGRIPPSARTGPAELVAGYATLPVIIKDEG